MDVDTQLLRAFLAIAEEGNITRAAERLSVAQPALSKQLRRLERAVQADLFVRGRHGAELTAAGQALLAGARDTVATWEATQRRVRTAARAGLPQLTVGFIANGAGELTPLIARRFAELQPHVELHMQQCDWSDPTAGLHTGTTDAALLRLPVPDPGSLVLQPLFTEDMCLALPADHRLAVTQAITIADLVDEPFVATAGPPAWRNWWLAADRRQGKSPIIGALVGTPDEWLAAILNGRGISFAFASAARFYTPPGIVYRDVPDLPQSVVAVAYRYDTRNPAVDDFVRAATHVAARA